MPQPCYSTIVFIRRFVSDHGVASTLRSSRPNVVIDEHYLLPASGKEFTSSYRNAQRRSEESCLDVAVPVSVMPCLFMLIDRTWLGKSVYRPFQVFHRPRFVFDGRQRPCLPHYKYSHQTCLKVEAGKSMSSKRGVILTMSGPLSMGTGVNVLE